MLRGMLARGASVAESCSSAPSSLPCVEASVLNPDAPVFTPLIDVQILEAEIVGLRSGVVALTSALDDLRDDFLKGFCKLESSFREDLRVAIESLQRDLPGRISNAVGELLARLPVASMSPCVTRLPHGEIEEINDSAEVAAVAGAACLCGDSSTFEELPPLGGTVVLHGLATERFNGKFGVVIARDDGRVRVTLSPGSPPIRVKYANALFPARCLRCQLEVSSSRWFACCSDDEASGEDDPDVFASCWSGCLAAFCIID